MIGSWFMFMGLSWDEEALKGLEHKAGAPWHGGDGLMVGLSGLFLP